MTLLCMGAGLNPRLNISLLVSLFFNTVIFRIMDHSDDYSNHNFGEPLSGPNILIHFMIFNFSYFSYVSEYSNSEVLRSSHWNVFVDLWIDSGIFG